MAVQSYLSLYTWLLGWQLYDQIWALLANLGFLAIPFAVIAIKAVCEPLIRGMELKKIGDMAVVKMLVLMLLALMVLVTAGIPTVELTPAQVNYTPRCVKDPKPVTPNNSGTSFDNLVTIPTSIRVPLWWYLVMAVSNGVTDQAKSLVECPVLDLRALQDSLITTNIKYADTKAEVSRFRNECYLPAYNRYIQYVQDKTHRPAIMAGLKTYGQGDVAWIGSEVFQTIPGFYDSLYAQSPVNGFPYTGSEQDAIQSQTGQPQWERLLVNIGGNTRVLVYEKNCLRSLVTIRKQN